MRPSRSARALLVLCPWLLQQHASAAPNATWAYRSSSDATYSFPAVSPTSSVVYISNDKGGLTAASTADGSVMWDVAVTQKWIRSAPAVSADGNAVYVGSTDHRLYAVNAADGKTLWSFETGSIIMASPAVSKDGKCVLFGSADNDVYNIRASDGVLNWRFPTQYWVRSTPTDSPDGSVVYAGSDDHNIYALRASDGTLLWNHTTQNWVASSPALSPDGSALYVSSFDGSLYALRAKDGALLWKAPTNASIESSPVVSSDGATVYVGSTDKNVYAMNAGDGAVKWSYEAPAAVVALALSPKHVMYALSKDGGMSVLREKDGGVVESVSVGKEGYARPAITGDGSGVYVGGSAGVLAYKGSEGVPQADGEGEGPKTLPPASVTQKVQQGRHKHINTGRLVMYMAVLGGVFIMLAALVFRRYQKINRVFILTFFNTRKGNEQEALEEGRHTHTDVNAKAGGGEGGADAEEGVRRTILPVENSTNQSTVAVSPSSKHDASYGTPSSIKSSNAGSHGSGDLPLTPLYFLCADDPGMHSSAKSIVRDGYSILPSAPLFKLKISPDRAAIEHENACLRRVHARKGGVKHVVNIADCIEIPEPPSALSASFQHDGPLYALVLEKGEGNMRNLILERNAWLYWTHDDYLPAKITKIRLVLLQIAGAVKAIHDGGLVWRDLKPENLVVFQQPVTCEYTWKAVDLGAALPIGAPLDNACTPAYAPPEVARARTHPCAHMNVLEGLRTISACPAYDSWSLGMLLLELLEGKHYLMAEFQKHHQQQQAQPLHPSRHSQKGAVPGGQQHQQAQQQNLAGGNAEGASHNGEYAAVWSRLASSNFVPELHAYIDTRYGRKLPNETRILRELLAVDPDERLSISDLLRRCAFAGHMPTPLPNPSAEPDTVVSSSPSSAANAGGGNGAEAGMVPAVSLTGNGDRLKTGVETDEEEQVTEDDYVWENPGFGDYVWERVHKFEVINKKVAEDKKKGGDLA